METHIDLSDRPDPPRRTRIGTGLPSLNRVLSGGLRARGVTTIECDSPQIADALVTTVARRIGVPTLLAGTDLQGLTTQLIAGEAAVSRRDASRGTLDEDDWTRIAAAVGKLAERRVHLSAASTLGGVREAILERPETTVVLVLRPERLGAIDLV